MLFSEMIIFGCFPFTRQLLKIWLLKFVAKATVCNVPLLNVVPYSTFYIIYLFPVVWSFFNVLKKIFRQHSAILVQLSKQTPNKGQMFSFYTCFSISTKGWPFLKAVVASAFLHLFNHLYTIIHISISFNKNTVMG